MPGADGPIVVKLGGSHAFSSHLRGWIATLADHGGRMVVVPGGGPFADSVREAQPRMGFDDHTAHHLALLAMEQYGCALASFDPRLTLARSAAAIRRGLQHGMVPVWLPTRMVLRAGEIPASWSVTSDSLAAWLAGKIRATQVLLVKPLKLDAQRVGAAEIAARGIVDVLFPRFLAASGATAWILGPSDQAAAGTAIRSAAQAGTVIDLP